MKLHASSEIMQFLWDCVLSLSEIKVMEKSEEGGILRNTKTRERMRRDSTHELEQESQADKLLSFDLL